MQVREQWKNPADGSVEHCFAIAEEILDGSLRGQAAEGDHWLQLPC
jgi:hypothetical protein